MNRMIRAPPDPGRGLESVKPVVWSRIPVRSGKRNAAVHYRGHADPL